MQSVLALVSSRPRTSGLYGCFFIGCLFVYWSLQAKQTGAFDVVLTLSAGLQVLAFALLVCDTRSQVGEGLSEKTLWAFLIANITRLSTTLWGEGYVPEDNTVDVYLYQMLEVTGVVLLSYKILSLSTLRSMMDVGQGFERWNVLIGMVVAAVFLGWLTKSTGHNDYFADLSWMTSVWLEAFALVPQVQLLASSGGQLDESAVHFACVTLASSLAFGAFWWKIAAEHHQEFMKEGYHGFLFGIVIASAIRVFLCGVYVYLFVKSSKSLGLPGAGKKGQYEMCAQEIEDEL